jgi:hypothetical protein
MERRNVMLAAGGAIACAASASAIAGEPPFAKLNRAAFAALVGQPLIVKDGARGIPMTLEWIRDGRPAHGEAHCSLHLAGSAGKPLKSGPYQVYHASFGIVPLFVEAVGKDATYRIQFSNLT